MSRLTRVSFLLVMAVAMCSTVALANIPSPELSNVPDAITLSTGAPFVGNPIGSFLVNVQGSLGAVNGALVEVEISAQADALIAWCQGHTPPLFSGFSNASGNITFNFQGGGCIEPNAWQGPPQLGPTFIGQVRADGVILDEVYIVSPDAVNNNGKLPTTAPIGRNCIAGSTQVGLADGVFHTRSIKLGLVNICTKMTPPFNAAVGVLDAVYITPYVKQSKFCTCQ
jgi:hypothetical protein